MAEEVEGDVAEGDVLLELRGAGDPAGQLLGQDEGVIAQPERVLRDVRTGDGIEIAGQLGGEVQRLDGDRPVRPVVLRPEAGLRCGTPSEAV